MIEVSLEDHQAKRTFGLAERFKITEKVDGPIGEGSSIAVRLHEEERTKVKAMGKTIKNLIFKFIFLILIRQYSC